MNDDHATGAAPWQQGDGVNDGAIDEATRYALPSMLTIQHGLEGGGPLLPEDPTPFDYA